MPVMAEQDESTKKEAVGGRASIGPIPAGWKVLHNGLDGDAPFGEDMLQVWHEGKNLLVDLGWYGGCQEFVIYVHEGDFSGRLVTEARTDDLMSASVKLLGLLARYG
jgi:hypothetical protein